MFHIIIIYYIIKIIISVVQVSINVSNQKCQANSSSCVPSEGTKEIKCLLIRMEGQTQAYTQQGRGQRPTCRHKGP